MDSRHTEMDLAGGKAELAGARLKRRAAAAFSYQPRAAVWNTTSSAKRVLVAGDGLVPDLQASDPILHSWVFALFHRPIVPRLRTNRSAEYSILSASGIEGTHWECPTACPLGNSTQNTDPCGVRRDAQRRPP
jgi:hypothetical protein